MATLIAMVLPWTIHRLGKDPAFGSGALVTVIQDLLSILIYFLMAAYVVGWISSLPPQPGALDG